MIAKRALMAIAAALFSAPAGAQEGSEGGEKRTVESAQRFLAETLGDQLATTVTFSTYARNRSAWDTPSPQFTFAKDDVNTQWFPMQGQIGSIRTTGRCETTINLIGLRRQFHTAREEEFGYSPAKYAVTNISSVEYIIDWSKVNSDPRRVSDASLDDQSKGISWTAVQLSIGKADQYINVFLPASAEAAERIVFAMNFLRAQCAPTNDTGF